MSKYTPGPWRATQRTVTAPETEDRLGLEVRVYGGNSDDHRANCRLIAAAPDLLDALMELNARLLRCSALGISSAEAYDSFYQGIAQEAIAKATGETP